MPAEPPKDISRIFEEGTLIDEALNRAAQEAIVQHKRLGQPLVVWREGKTVLIPPEEINLDDASKPHQADKGSW